MVYIECVYLPVSSLKLKVIIYFSSSVATVFLHCFNAVDWDGTMYRIMQTLQHCWSLFLFNIIFQYTFLLQLKHYNADFTQVEIWFRFVFLVLTFMVTVSDKKLYKLLLLVNIFNFMVARFRCVHMTS